MVKSQARRLVPGSNFSRWVQALIRVSCTRSSASDPLRLSDQAKARRAGMRASTSSCHVSAVPPLVWPSVGEEARLASGLVDGSGDAFEKLMTTALLRPPTGPGPDYVRMARRSVNAYAHLAFLRVAEDGCPMNPAIGGAGAPAA